MNPGVPACEATRGWMPRSPRCWLAERAKSRSGDALRTALDAYAAARELGGAATGLSLDASATVFEMGGILARLGRA